MKYEYKHSGKDNLIFKVNKYSRKTKVNIIINLKCIIIIIIITIIIIVIICFNCPAV